MVRCGGCFGWSIRVESGAVVSSSKVDEIIFRLVSETSQVVHVLERWTVAREGERLSLPLSIVPCFSTRASSCRKYPLTTHDCSSLSFAAANLVNTLRSCLEYERFVVLCDFLPWRLILSAAGDLRWNASGLCL
ncbi:hypothetical protein Droror1_Dr00018640 [Drosera rotundifolia]